MQSQDEHNKIVNAEVFENSDELKEKLVESMEKAEELGAKSHLVAKFPLKGSLVTIHGLQYEVKFVDFKHGDLRLKLIGIP